MKDLRELLKKWHHELGSARKSKDPNALNDIHILEICVCKLEQELDCPNRTLSETTGQIKAISEALSRKSLDLSQFKGKYNATEEFEDRLTLRIEILKDLSEALASI